MSWLGITLAVLIGVAIAVVVVLWWLRRFYQRASKELAFVRTGWGGQKVVIHGGAQVFPVLHEVLPVNLSTLKLEIRRDRESALITQDRLRVDATVSFYVRVQQSPEAVACAAQTLGRRTMDPQALRELIEGKFVDALRTVAVEFTMESLHEQRAAFIAKVRGVTASELIKNGLELESAALIALDQTEMTYFNPSNAFDAQGLTRLTEDIERSKKSRNAIEQDNLVAVRKKNLEAEQASLDIERESTYARLKQEQDLEQRRAQQRADIAQEQALKEQEAEVARIHARQETEQARIASERALHQQQVARELDAATLEIRRQREVTLAEQARQIALAEHSQLESEARSKADLGRAEAVKAEEAITQARERAIAERKKAVALILTSLETEREQIRRRSQAETERVVVDLKAETSRREAQAFAETSGIKAEGYRKRHAVEAEAARQMAEAENVASAETRASRLRLKLLDKIEGIVRESVKPLERIDSIRVAHLGGNLGNHSGGHAQSSTPTNQPAAEGGLAEQLLQSALKYRAQAPLVDQLLADVGLDARTLDPLKAVATRWPTLEAQPKVSGAEPPKDA